MNPERVPEGSFSTGTAEGPLAGLEWVVRDRLRVCFPRPGDSVCDLRPNSKWATHNKKRLLECGRFPPSTTLVFPY